MAKTNEELIKELKDIRIRLTEIYMALGNPKHQGADMILNRDIIKFEKDLRIT